MIAFITSDGCHAAALRHMPLLLRYDGLLERVMPRERVRRGVVTAVSVAAAARYYATALC